MKFHVQRGGRPQLAYLGDYVLQRTSPSMAGHLACSSILLVKVEWRLRQSANSNVCIRPARTAIPLLGELPCPGPSALLPLPLRLQSTLVGICIHGARSNGGLVVGSSPPARAGSRGCSSRAQPQVVVADEAVASTVRSPPVPSDARVASLQPCSNRGNAHTPCARGGSLPQTPFTSDTGIGQSYHVGGKTRGGAQCGIGGVCLIRSWPTASGASWRRTAPSGRPPGVRGATRNAARVDCDDDRLPPPTACGSPAPGGVDQRARVLRWRHARTSRSPTHRYIGVLLAQWATRVRLSRAFFLFGLATRSPAWPACQRRFGGPSPGSGSPRVGASSSLDIAACVAAWRTGSSIARCCRGCRR